MATNSTANPFIPSSKSFHAKLTAPPLTTISLPFKSPSITITKQKTSKLCKAFLGEQRKLTDVWREIHGDNNWVGLLDPMDPLLRSELIRYGEMAQSCYDAFDQDSYSKYCGSCRYTRQELFNSLEMHDIGYTITRFLYATAANTNLYSFFKKSRWPKMWSRNANWIGYVAVSDDKTSKRLGRRDIVIAWRGTVTDLEWDIIVNSLVPAPSNKLASPDKSIRIDSGLLDLYTNKEDGCPYCKYSAREQILVEVQRLMEKYCKEKELSITITGHSLGSALGILSGYDIVESGLNIVGGYRAVRVSVFSFAGWKVGNARFKERLDLLGLRVLRVVNVHDVVTKMPGLILNKKNVNVSAGESMWTYSHVGEELLLYHKSSPFLKSDSGDVHSHKLEVHLHLLDGYHGKGHRFVLASGRDIALVNKDNDFLKDHHMVPPFWWQEKNKGMIKTKDGYWMQVERSKFEGHPKDTVDYLKQLCLE